MIIGVDDTDSIDGMCTTYLAANLFRRFRAGGYPKIVRLNPNIPYKTRGNGAVSFEAEGGEDIEDVVIDYVKKNAHLAAEGTNPGVVFVDDCANIDILNEFYKRAVSEIVTIEAAKAAAKKAKAQTHGFKNGRGIIGALAAAGAALDDRTYELIAYRKPENYGKPRWVDEESVIQMDKKTNTFNNFDYETNRVLIMPRGDDPILCGIRGQTPLDVESAWKMLKTEPVEFVQIFETNQGTDAHLRDKRIADLKPYDCARIKAKVSSKPRTIAGGHVFFGISDGTKMIECAAYEPTGSFRDRARALIIGDEVTISGCIGKYTGTLNLEKFEVLSLEKQYEEIRPVCCGRNAKSEGKDKGFQCKTCGRRFPESAVVFRQVERGIKIGSYEVTAGARRHLSKPLNR